MGQSIGSSLSFAGRRERPKKFGEKLKKEVGQLHNIISREESIDLCHIRRKKRRLHK